MLHDILKSLIELKSVNIKNIKKIFNKYILFCLYTFFKYSKNIDNTRVFEFCAKYLFQNIIYKKKCLKIIENYLINVNINELDKLNDEELLKKEFTLNYNGNLSTFSLKDIFFINKNRNEILKSIINNNCYSFEYDLKNNNLFFKNEELNKLYENYIYTILKSDITKEYFECLKDFDDYNFLFDNNSIIEELKDNTLFVYFPCDNVTGITDKDLYFIFINKKYKYSPVFKRIIEVNGKSLSQSHEYINHCARILLTANNYNKDKQTPENPYKNANFYEETKEFKDGGDKWEIIIFGQKINKIFLNGLIFLFNTNNFNNTIEKYKQLFKSENKTIYFSQIKKNLTNFYDNDILLKNIFKEFGQNEIDSLFKKKDSWLLNDQGIAANIKDEDFFNVQGIELVICGSFDHDD